MEVFRFYGVVMAAGEREEIKADNISSLNAPTYGYERGNYAEHIFQSNALTLHLHILYIVWIHSELFWSSLN